ncbi:MAG: hypothetical protein IME99_04095, partial [Proteobacteria bacterium]|nr:hypothetical protein [Pseudomonadota bacterium]
VAGVLLNNPASQEADDKSHAHNRAEISRFCSVPVLGTVEFNEYKAANEFPDSIDLGGLLSPGA